MAIETRRAQLRTAVTLAARVVPTHYPLETFIAVNPLAGLEGLPFEQALRRAGDLYGMPGTLGEFFWGGAASTAFWIDPKEDLAVVFMTQVIGTEARLTLRRDLRTLAYSAMTESYA